MLNNCRLERGAIRSGPPRVIEGEARDVAGPVKGAGSTGGRSKTALFRSAVKAEIYQPADEVVGPLTRLLICIHFCSVAHPLLYRLGYMVGRRAGKRDERRHWERRITGALAR
jgi:hypothetical protein